MPNIKQFFKDTHQKLKDFKGKVAAMRKAREGDSSQVSVKEKKQEKLEITVSAGTIAKFVIVTILLLLLAGFVYQIRDILVIFFVSLLFAAALDPMVDALEHKRIPRAVGVIVIYIALFLLIGLFVSNLIPIVASEVSQLAGKIQDFIVNIMSGKIELPKFMDGLKPMLSRFTDGMDISKVGDYKDILLKIANQLSQIAGNVFNSVLVVFNGLFNTLMILVITFLMTVDEKGIDKFILSLFPAKYADYITQKSKAVKEKIGYWLRGQIVLCVIVGVLVYIGLLIIGLLTKKVEYAATIAMVAGLTEVIPYAGPFVAWLIALPIIANQSVMLLVWMTVLMYIVQTLENNFIVPLVMNKAVGLSPILVIFAMLVGFSFLGVLGMVLAVPVATTIAIFIKDYADKDK